MAHRLITVDTEMNTDVPGIAAIGDTVTYAGKLGLIASGFGEAPNAVNQLMMTLYPERRSPLHSTLAETATGQLQLTMKEVRGTTEETLAVDDLIVNYGFIADNKVIRNWHVTPTMAHRLITVDTEMNTDVPGIAAIGDTVTYAGKLGLIASGFGEAPNAVNQLMMTLYPERRSPLHSTLAETATGQLQLTMKEVRGTTEETLAVDDLIVNYGFIADNKVIRNWHVTPTMAHRLITVDTEMNTDVPGIAAIGDTVTYAGKLGRTGGTT
ncbi:hypothetical protein WP50_09855 [Lactiplantibacillus plantarum]|nr:hypothetical protein WP50_09855 [Lactiplantibacillus plantarum]